MIVDREQIEEILRRSQQTVRRSIALCEFSQKRSAATRDAIRASLNALKKSEQFMKYNGRLMPCGPDRVDRREERISPQAEVVRDELSFVNDGQNKCVQGGGK